jgi:ABC-type dipeptide/oligopeptide/nickel transport system permease component
LVAVVVMLLNVALDLASSLINPRLRHER